MAASVSFLSVLMGHVTHRLRCTVYNNIAGLSANQRAAFSGWSVDHVKHNL